MSEVNWFGGGLEQARVMGGGGETLAPEVQKPESITEGDRIRARVAVSRGESEMYFIKIPPCDFSMLETHPAGGDVFEIVHNETVFGYTKNKDAFGASDPEVKYV